jgi:hypothetical protein
MPAKGESCSEFVKQKVRESNARRRGEKRPGALGREAPNRTHGRSTTLTYASWRNMRRRCRDERYGSRGITVCERWLHSFENFLADMGERPKGYTLSRLDHSGNYEPANCEWAPAGSH